nr:PDZ domain-containing protein [uncultured Sphingomonas sp.]
MKIVMGTLLAALYASAANAQVNYAVDLTKPEHHSANVAINFPETSGPYLDVKMPAWRTGKYVILNLANGVSQFNASDASGKPLKWQKVDKSTWRVSLSDAQPVRVSYQIYGNELGLRSRHIDDSHAYLDASAVFMYADKYRKEPVNVALTVPQGWQSYSGMERTGAQGFTAANWDALVDSPIETGQSVERSFSADGKDYQIVIWGKGNYDADGMAADFKKIVTQAPAIWKTYPFNRYLFIIHATDGVGGATEHMNSTVIQMPRTMFQPRDMYLRFLSTAAHEFIHTWNVKAYRAAPMVPYAYQAENYTNLLWLEEGSTEYFSDPFLVRAGILSPKEYFQNLADAIDDNKNRPGRLVQSVSQASFDEWISQVSNERANNAWVNIYTEGAIASWALDIALLQQTGGKVSYRDVHRLLYERFDSKVKGFTDRDVLAILQELTGKSWNAWWQRYVESPSDVDFNTLLRPVGLQFGYDGGDQKTKAYAGWRGKLDDNGVRLTNVLADSPAWNAGLGADDVIVAIDGTRVTAESFDAALSSHKPGDVVTVRYIRRGETAEKKVTLGGTYAGKPTISTLVKPTAAQKALFERWMLVPYPAP